MNKKTIAFILSIILLTTVNTFAREFHVAKSGNDHAAGTASERFTPYHYPHSTKVAGMMTLMEGDDQYYNNIFIKTEPPPYDIWENANRWKRAEGTQDFGLGMYNEYPATLPERDMYISEMSQVKLPVVSENNVFLNGAVPYKNGMNDIVNENTDIEIGIEEKSDGIYLVLETTDDVLKAYGKYMSSEDLGVALVPDAIFESPAEGVIHFNTDYFGGLRGKAHQGIGPFNSYDKGKNLVKVWPK